MHTFSRLSYQNITTPFYRNLQEFRTLFRPNTPLWTHLLTNDQHYAPLPSADAIANQVVVQDATWSYAAAPNDSYVQQEGIYFTKYIFADTWRDHDVHGMYADGTQIVNNYTFGSWLVINTKDTYFWRTTAFGSDCGWNCTQLHVSNHHGDGTPNITDGFDRTFGPVSSALIYHPSIMSSGSSQQYYFFTKDNPEHP